MVTYAIHALQILSFSALLAFAGCGEPPTNAPMQLQGYLYDTGYLQVCPEGGFAFVEATYTGTAIGMSVALADDPRRPIARAIPREEGYIFVNVAADCVSVYGTRAEQSSEFVLTVWRE